MDTIPKKGKRYRLQSRPWDSSYLDIIEDDEGEWIFYPISVSQPSSGADLADADLEARLLAKKAQVLSLEAEMQGYVAHNQYRISRGETIAHNENAFANISILLDQLALEILNS